MGFEKEVWYRYHQVHAIAQKEARKAEKAGLECSPKQLKHVLENRELADNVELGTIEIPVDAIVGTANFDENDLYSPNFHPIASINSPYASEWCQIYLDYLTDKGWDNPIRCFEFLGRFYVQDGKKRVSVLKANGATVTEAIVTRIMPALSQDEEIVNYYKFLKNYEKSGLYQVALTNPDSFEKLQTAFGYDTDHVWNESDRFHFLFNLIPVAYALQNAFHGNLNITAADAMVALLEDYTIAEIRKMQPWVLSKELQNSWVKLYKILDPDFEVALAGVIKKAS